jgi:acetyltransferase-like isoleucine patch superfamily enzyme
VELDHGVQSARGDGAGGRLVVDRRGAITSRHYIDCSGDVSVGAFTVVAGVRSTILTHQIDVVESRQTVAPVAIGDYCFIGSNCRITPGSAIPDRCVTAMGSVVVGELPQPGMLYAGVPARPVKELGDATFFNRPDAFVDI